MLIIEGWAGVGGVGVDWVRMLAATAVEVPFRVGVLLTLEVDRLVSALSHGLDPVPVGSSFRAGK